MCNPIQLAFRALNNYVNFWDKTNTYGKVCAHTLTLFGAVTVRWTVNASYKNIVQVYEMAAVVALITHIFIATFIGSDEGFRAKKE